MLQALLLIDAKYNLIHNAARKELILGAEWKKEISGWLKGKIVEVLIERLLRASGNIVSLTGYEQKIAGDGPDLKLTWDRGKQHQYLEVKFRWSRYSDKDRIEWAKHYDHSVMIVLVSYNPQRNGERFNLLTLPDFKMTPLVSAKPWHVDAELLKDCEELLLVLCEALPKNGSSYAD